MAALTANNDRHTSVKWKKICKSYYESDLRKKNDYHWRYQLLSLSSRYIQSFDWQVQIGLSTSSMVNLYSPLLSLSFCINNCRDLTMELNKEELDNLLSLLEEADKEDNAWAYQEGLKLYLACQAVSYIYNDAEVNSVD
ncbi:COMM domain-containing protein 8 [Trichoplax sp. H2]|nr:COMM domain-containing protein 8 [Trichoplax sp. H2]|eukprot:RDD47394.1 COMM domain-containing protein 8 [Trichoplax sp. H2]